MLNIINKKRYTDQSGFTLVEMAIVIAIIGLLIGGGLSFYKPLDQNLRTVETKDRMDKIANAMSSYALRNNRVPCPAAPDAPQASPNDEPFGAERGSGSTGANTGSCTAVLSEGVVPYRTLGLRQEDVIDGFGSYITYRVSPAFTDNNNSGSDTVHDNCRTAQWINAGANFNPEKARFCCPSTGSFPVNTDIVVSDANGSVVAARTTDVGSINTEEATPSGNSLAVVYTLISHGSNRYGKYLIGGATPTAKYTQTDVFGTGEAENQDGDINFSDSIEISAETTAYYDDIILWRTQDSLMSELGTNTCATP